MKPEDLARDALYGHSAFTGGTLQAFTEALRTYGESEYQRGYAARGEEIALHFEKLAAESEAAAKLYMRANPAGSLTERREYREKYETLRNKVQWRSVAQIIRALAAPAEGPSSEYQRGRGDALRQAAERDWSVRAGDPCDVCGLRVAGACLPCRFKGCERHQLEHNKACAA